MSRSPDIEIKSMRPRRKLILWAIDLVVQNTKHCYNKGLLGVSKKKSLTNPRTKFIFAFLEGKAIGFCAFRIEEDMAFVYEIHLEAGSQSKKIGKRLLDHCKEVLPHRIDKIFLQVHLDNIRAIKFYRENGFTEDYTFSPAKSYKMMYFSRGNKER